MQFWNLYLNYIKRFIKARSEYRTSFFWGIISNFYSYLITYLTFYVIIDNFGHIDGWDFYDLCILYGLNLLTYAIAAMLFWSVFGIEHDMLAGNLDILLIRPISLMKSLICRKFVDTFLGQILVACIFMITAFANNVEMNFIKGIYVGAAIIGGILIHSATMIFFGSISFWTKRSLFLADLIYYDLRVFLEYPLSIFPIWVKYMFTFILPWALINYYPSLIILEKCNATFDYVLGIISPIIGAGFFYGAKVFFNYGLGRYNSSGS